MLKNIPIHKATKSRAHVLTLILHLLIIQLSLSAQVVSGKVLDFNNRPITDVHILNSTSGNHTHSDSRGAFLLQEIQIGDTVIFTHLGYEIQEEIIKEVTSPIQVTLLEKLVALDEVVISPQINALSLIADVDIETNPVNSSQDILKQVPGLFIGQHAGGGKAEQIFLRGFDIDHGTDIAITVDGLPVNMVSHAHGQGYADLHFVIPETVDRIDFGKGPYFADKGNFNTAGYVNLKTKNNLDNSSIKLEAGQFNTKRMLGMLNLVNTEKQNGYIATEYLSTDGFFESPQNFSRINLFGKYQASITEMDKLGITVSHFTSKWDASGQVPQRAVDAGLISRFGAIDDTEGGQTARTNLLVSYDKFINDESFIRNKMFYSNHDFELYSNFTFFLEDPINSDQIRQKEERNIFGLTSDYHRIFSQNHYDITLQAGISFRNDNVLNNELSHTYNRSQTLEQLQFGNVNETNIGSHVSASFEFGNLTINPGLRYDLFDFQYNDILATNYSTRSSSKNILSPKLNVLYNYSSGLQLYIKSGKGFHSNDTRVVVDRNGKEILPAAFGFDAGFIWKPGRRFIVNTAYWNLFLKQEFVYVGDAGIVELSGRTQRQGVDLSVRYQPLDWLFWNIDATYAHARSIDETEGNNFIPLAPDFTLTSGLNIIHPSGIHGGINMRHLNDRPANENNSIVAEGYTVVDFNLGYKWEKINLGLQIQNLLNTEWNETQFATESRLTNESSAVEEIHFTPGTPFAIKGSVEYTF